MFQISHKNGMDYSRKKQGEVGGTVNIELTGVSKMNSYWNFRDQVKKEVEFQGVIKKKPCGISIIQGF